MADNPFQLAQSRALDSGGYSDMSGYHSGDGTVIASADEIQKDAEAARRKALSFKYVAPKVVQAVSNPISYFSNLLSGNVVRNIPKSIPKIPQPVSRAQPNVRMSYADAVTDYGRFSRAPDKYAGTSSMEHGYVDSSGRQIATPREIQTANKQKLAELSKKVRVREMEIKKSKVNIPKIQMPNDNIYSSAISRLNAAPKDITPQDIDFGRVDDDVSTFKFEYKRPEISRVSRMDAAPPMLQVHLGPGDPGYMGSEEIGTTRTKTEADYYTDKIMQEQKDETIDKIGMLMKIDTSVDASNVDDVFKLASTYLTAEEKLQKVLGSTATDYDRFLIQEKIAAAAGFPDVTTMSQDMAAKKEDVKDIIEQYSGVDQPVRATLARNTPGISDWSDVILQSAKSKRTFEKTTKEVQDKAAIEKQVFAIEYGPATDFLSSKARDTAGSDAGKVFFPEKEQLFALDLLETRTREEARKKLKEKEQIEADILADNTRVENTYLNTPLMFAEKEYSDVALSAGKTVSDVLLDPAERQKYVEQYRKATLIQNDNIFSSALNSSTVTPVVSDLALAPFVIRDDIDKKYNEKVEALRTDNKGIYKMVEGDDGIIKKSFFYNTQKDLDAEHALFNTYNKEMGQFMDTAQTDFSEYGYQQDEIDKLNVIDAELAIVLKQHNKALDTIKGIDYTYKRDKELQTDIDADKFKPADTSLRFTDVLIPGSAALRQPVVKNIGRVFEKDVGGFVAKGIQGIGQVTVGAADDIFNEDVGEIVYTGKEYRDTMERYGIKTPGRKAGELGVAAGVFALGAASGGAGWAAGFGGAMMAQPVISYGTEELGYWTAPEEQKVFMRDYTTFRGGMRQSWDAENVKIGEGWDGQAGGFDGTVRNIASAIPLSGYIPGIGAKEAFKENAKKYYTNLGYTGDKLDAAVNASSRQRNWGIGGEAAGILLGNVSAELVGRRALSKAILGGTAKKSFWTGFTKVGSAGIVEGMLLEQARQDKEYEDRDFFKASQAGLVGYGTAGLIGGGMAWSGAGGKLNKVLQKGGYWTDWYEKPGDMLANVFAKKIPAIGKYSGAVRPKVFTFAATTLIGTKTQVAVNTEDITNIKTIPGGAVITLTNGQTVSIANTKGNTNTMINMQSYFDSELKSVKAPQSKTSSLTQVETNINQELQELGLTQSKTSQPMPVNTFANAEALAVQRSADTRALSKTQVAAMTDVFSDAQININERTNVIPETKTTTDANTNTNVNTNINPNVNPNVNPNINPNALAQSIVFSSILPYGRVKLPQGYGKYGSGQYMDSWLANNKIADYAGDWMRAQQAKQLPFSGPTKKAAGPDGYDKAQGAMDRLFGAGVASGAQFKQQFGTAVSTKNVQLKRMMDSRRKKNFMNKRIQDEAFQQGGKQKTMKITSTNAILKMLGKSK